MLAISGLTRVTNSVVVLVMATPPGAGLGASEPRPVEPLLHPPEPVEPARIGGVRVVDDAVLERERAHARRLAHERGRVGTCILGEPTHSIRCSLQLARREVVFHASLPLLLLRDRHVEVVVEVALVRRRPWERPAHPTPERLDVRERRA